MATTLSGLMSQNDMFGKVMSITDEIVSNVLPFLLLRFLLMSF